MGGYRNATRRGGAPSARRGSWRVGAFLPALAVLSLAGVGSSHAYSTEDRTRPVEQRSERQAEHSGPSHGKQDDRRTGQASGEDDAETEAERDLALASTWHLDPALLRPLPTDSRATGQARQQLAEIAARFERVLTRYEAARAEAEVAGEAAREAEVALTRARAQLREAAALYRADRRLFVDVIIEAYTTDSVGDFGKLLSAETGKDLASGLVTLQQMGTSQGAAVVEAERSRDRLREAAVAVAEAERESRDSLVRADAAVTRATAVRTEVVEDLRTARRLVQQSALADQLTLERGYDVRQLGDITFPLPPAAPFVDQQNWGGESRHWASVHTGDDLSTGCGTPVLAATDGTVEIRTDQSWSGPWLVMVSTGEGELSTWYAHLQTVVVEDGQQVEAGDTIGLVGALGNATGCHLHFEVHTNGGGIYEDNVDPVRWLRDAGAYPS